LRSLSLPVSPASEGLNGFLLILLLAWALSSSVKIKD